MKKLLLLAAVPLLLGANFYWSNQPDKRLPDGFCDGVRFDGVMYEDWLSAEALELDDDEYAIYNREDATVRLSRNYRCRWINTLKDLQVNQCGQSTIEVPRCGGRRR